MSTPRTLALPTGVEHTSIDTPRGVFAAHVTRGGGRGHVLLLPGWTGSKEDFTPVLPLLAEAGYDATSIDQRGQLATPGADDDDYSLPALAADAVAVAVATGHARSHLLGHSFGGLVAQQAVVDSPASWLSLSLLCTGPGALGSSPQRRLEDLINALDGDVPMSMIATALRGGAVAESAEIEAFVQEKFERTSRVSLRAMTRHLLDAPDQTDAVAATGVPAWVCRGVDDNAWPHTAQDEQARRLGTETVEIPGSAHSPAIENPQALVDAWLPFLAAH